jgi:hypothetical protein
MHAILSEILNQNQNIYYLTSITTSVIIMPIYNYASKSKLLLSECNDLYFIAIAFIAFTLNEIKQSPVFGGTPAVV